ncbi:ribosomal protection-like ABC-F family protein [Fictibacillus phosphorivorans]|uniref:ribosomal protection-like ABC-F family protein n=1 Tax=Fictibacillus phosphorivorans TaxID=1221500 RepID=UPI00203D0987|nr:ABC-F type ribosomal protection protein [Fictibacillus phosphorivorans]MCM3720162.1 ABC-F type ribosomal protection protein [Fictibacillus phosphorivorans]MCM3777852.1 ABC-F type ribosomal protection protein [Fictibacillus phosphorivorans]
MLLLEATGIEKSYNGNLILKQTEPFQLFNHDRIGLVGLNGSGKSTFLKLLSLVEEADSGVIQHYGSFAVVSQFEEGAQTITARSEGQWNLRGKNYETMSGGEKTRTQIAAALEQQPDILILDEPTSHLDVDGMDQLAKVLNHYKGAVLLVSHDRTFLDKVCTKILELDHQSFSMYPGNYTDYLHQKKQKQERQQFEYEQYMNEKSRLENAAKEKVSKAKNIKDKPARMSYSEAKLGKMKAKNARRSLERASKVIEKRIEMLDKKEKPKEQPKIAFDIQQFSVIHAKQALAVKHLSVEFGERQLFKNLSFTVKPGMKIVLTGKNGTGKSTLLETIYRGNEQIEKSQQLKVGYFHQHLKILDESKSILENVMENSLYDETWVRTILARLLFKREDVFKKVEVLSGGEKMKTALAKLFLNDYNLLLLDEPTNYLDLFTREALEEVLIAYPGTFIIATHDRRLMEKAATHVLDLQPPKAYWFEGSYREYLESKKDKKSVSSTHDHKDRLLKLELEMTDLIGRLSLSLNEEEKIKLEHRYQEVLKEIRLLKAQFS